jgi:hypothetical protein
MTREYIRHVADRDKELDAASPGRDGAPSAEWAAAWDRFQTWDRAWEDRLAKAVDAFTESAEVPMEAAGEDVKDRVDGILTTVRWTSAAIALRRALDVAADDRVAREEAARSSRRVAQAR